MTRSITQNQDRRRYVRHKVEAPCKIIEAKTGRAIPGITRDVSLGGLLVALRTPQELHAGDTIRIGVAWRGQAVIDELSMSDARVTRVFPPFNGQQTVAIQRIAEVPMPARAAA
ncbi:MAG: PilZ domain-containing protein [Phycisphaeraceae bacterium]|nr:MAG: PilZ domain-containing protein [Phycisphaeraceae bacterium]